MRENNEIFSKIPNELYIGDKSIYKRLRDVKTVLVIHYLYLLTNYEKKAVLTLDYLIEKCGYKPEKDTRKQFKNILADLMSVSYISFDGELKANKLVEIDTSKLIEWEDKFTQLYPSEIKAISSKSANTREFTNLLNIYCNLKCHAYKSDIKPYEEGYRARVSFPSEEKIETETNISRSTIKKCIIKLKEIGMITYANNGSKYYEKEPKVIIESENIYFINNLVEDVKEELKQGLKQNKVWNEKHGYIFTDRNKSKETRKRNGRKGYLVKKMNSVGLTDKETEELEGYNIGFRKKRNQSSYSEEPEKDEVLIQDSFTVKETNNDWGEVNPFGGGTSSVSILEVPTNKSAVLCKDSELSRSPI